VIFDPVLTRLFIIEAFSETEFKQLCQNHFPDVYDRFTDDMTRSEHIQLLINHCDRFGRFPQLMAVLESAKPTQYKKRFHIQV
jgi:hypothetical protein